jgi:hypothetical protein
MSGRPSRDWDAVFYAFAALPVNERSLVTLAKQLGVSLNTVKRKATRHRWSHRLRAIDERARQEREKRAIRKLNDRLEDNIRLVEATRLRFAERLRDPAYQPTAHEVVAMAKLELLIEGKDTHKLGVSTVSDEFREMIRQLPNFTQERILASVLTGVPYEEVLEIEAEMVSEEDEDGPTD